MLAAFECKTWKVPVSVSRKKLWVYIYFIPDNCGFLCPVFQLPLYSLSTLKLDEAKYRRESSAHYKGKKLNNFLMLNTNDSGFTHYYSEMKLITKRKNRLLIE